MEVVYSVLWAVIFCTHFTKYSVVSKLRTCLWKPMGTRQWTRLLSCCGKEVFYWQILPLLYNHHICHSLENLQTDLTQAKIGLWGTHQNFFPSWQHWEGKLEISLLCGKWKAILFPSYKWPFSLSSEGLNWELDTTSLIEVLISISIHH